MTDFPTDPKALHEVRRHIIAKIAMQDGPWSRGELWETWRYENDTEASRAPYLAYADRVLKAIRLEPASKAANGPANETMMAASA